MTVSTNTNKIAYAMNGSTTAFSFPFKIFETSDIVAIITDTTTGVETTLTETTDYTVSAPGNDYTSGGTVTVVDSQSSDYTLTIKREVPYTQDTDYVEGGPFPVESIENSLDRAVMLAQQNQEADSRALTIPEGETNDTEIPSLTDRAERVLGFDASGNPLMYANVPDLPVGDAKKFLYSNGLIPVWTVGLSWDEANTRLGIGTDSPDCDLHLKTVTGAICAKVESEDADAGIMQLQLYNDNGKEMSVGKLGSNVNFFGNGSGALLNRDGNMNIVCDSNDDIIFYTDETDAQSLQATEKMKIAADGAVDMQKGLVVNAEGKTGNDLVVKSNDGSTAVIFNSTANSTSMGNVSSANMTTIEADGTMVAKGDATCWDDLRFPAERTKKITGKEPKETAYKGGMILEFETAGDQAVAFNAQLPHAIVIGSDLDFHFHYVLETDGAGAGAENIKFDFSYCWAYIDGDFGTPQTLTATLDVQNKVADRHYLLDLGQVLESTAGGTAAVSGMLICSLARDNTVANDYGSSVFFLEADFHIEKDMMGSRQEYIK